MLFQLRKENIELNDEYNKMIDKKTRFEVEYLEMKKRLNDFEKEEESEKHEQFVNHLTYLSNQYETRQIRSLFRISLSQRSYSIHQFLSTKRTQTLRINCQL